MIVHIIGKGPGFLYAPDPCEGSEYSVWGLNDIQLYKKVDVLFNMHDLNTRNAPQKLCLTIAEQNNIPLYTLKEYEWLSNSIEYPLDEIIKEFGVKYFSCSISYMLALAIYNGAKKIKLWGVSFFTNQKDIAERAGVEFWVGVAVGRGIKVEVNEPTALIQVGKENKLYGYEKVCYENEFDSEAWLETEREKLNAPLKPSQEERQGQEVSQ